MFSESCRCNAQGRGQVTTPANLQTPGIYSFNATVSLAGDVNPSNNTYAGYKVTNDANSVGGTLNGPPMPGSSGSITLSCHARSLIFLSLSSRGECSA